MIQFVINTAAIIGFFLITPVSSAGVKSPWRFDPASKKWTKDESMWMVGANFIPSTAVNELEMFQPATFDPSTIDRELGYAASLGFNSVRVFLHNLLWSDGFSDTSGAFISMLNTFLDTTSRHDIGVMFVLLDSCWNADPKMGPQPEPTPYVHNSQWVQAPGYDIVTDETKFDLLEPYIKGIVGHFRNDSRVIAWYVSRISKVAKQPNLFMNRDVWNEPDNSGYSPDLIAPLISKVFHWCREVEPTQPLTTPVWKSVVYDPPEMLSSLEKVQIFGSDIISFHSYAPVDITKSTIESLKPYGKPLVCTEYMARGAGSYFDPHLGMMKDEGVCAFNWGLVSGRTQTIYPWDSANDPNPYEGIEPDPWFHGRTIMIL